MLGKTGKNSGNLRNCSEGILQILFRSFTLMIVIAERSLHILSVSVQQTHLGNLTSLLLVFVSFPNFYLLSTGIIIPLCFK